MTRGEDAAHCAAERQLASLQAELLRLDCRMNALKEPLKEEPLYDPKGLQFLHCRNLDALWRFR